MEYIKLQTIEDITNNFAKEKIVGSGAYGDVYRATYEGEEIAVKKLRPLQGIDDKKFDNEYRNLRKVSHQNVVRLVGYCYESRHKYMDYKGELVLTTEIQRVLCFEYMHGGSLDQHIQDESCGLEWPTCYKIIKGTCVGINHLHNFQGQLIYHLDLKPGNILLDESMTPKIGDLGLSRLVSSTKTRQTEMRDGTLGFMPPEYIDNGLISKKFDVFSFGVIIIKLLAGNTNFFRCTEVSPEQFIELVSESWTKKLQAEPGYSKPEIVILGVTSCVGIALKCVDKDRNKRPSIKDIVQELENLEAKLEKLSLASDVPKVLWELEKLSLASDVPKVLWRSCDTKVLSVDPTFELRFLFEPRKEASSCLQLTNKTNGAIAFRVKIDDNKYSVRPSQGTMKPCSRCYVVVMLRPQEAEPSYMRCDDVLLVHTTGVTQDLASKDGKIDYKELFEKATTNKTVDEVKLPIAYVAFEQ